jgi:hypothetical protein
MMKKIIYKKSEAFTSGLSLGNPRQYIYRMTTYRRKNVEIANSIQGLYLKWFIVPF